MLATFLAVLTLLPWSGQCMYTRTSAQAPDDTVAGGEPVAAAPVVAAPVVGPAGGLSVVQEAAADATEAARAVLERALRFQRGDKALAIPRGFRGRFYADVRQADGTAGINLDVEQSYCREPERLLTHRKDVVVGSDTSEGWDGTKAWFQDNASGRVVVYSDDPATFQVDLERVQSQLRLMPVFLDALVLDALVPRLREPLLAGAHQLEVPRRGPVEVQRVRARVDDRLFGPDLEGPPPLPGAPPPELDLELDIDAEGALWAIRVTTVGRRTPRSIELRFKYHVVTTSGLKVPANVRVFEDGASDESLSLGLAEVAGTDGPTLAFELDPEFEPGLFAVPR